MIYAFENCELDAGRFELRRDGAPVPLQPKVLELLLYLAARSHEVVSKSDLLGALWPDVSVGESSLTRIVSLARKAIGERPGSDALLQTVPRRGYRLSLPALPVRPGPGILPRPAIAVLPFVNRSGDPAQDYLSDGIAEDLLIRLSYFRWFPVVSRSSSFAFRGGASDVKRVGLELEAGYVVEGSVRRAGDRVRVNAQLVDATTGHHVWAARYDREFREVFALQDEITDAIVGAIEPELWLTEGERAVRREPQNLDAWSCTQRGWWHMQRATQADRGLARTLCARALELDPHLPRAFYALATRADGSLVLRSDDTEAQLGADAVSALELPGGTAPSELGRAVAFGLGGELTSMTESLERAVQLDPASSLELRWLGLFLASDSGHAAQGPQDDALGGVRQLASALAYFAAEHYDGVLATLDESHRHPEPSLPLGVRAAALACSGAVDGARELLADAQRRHPEFSLGPLRAILASGDPVFLRRLDLGLRRAGWRE